MEKNILILIFAVCLVILVSCKSYDAVIINNGDEKIRINIEIADNVEERAYGLMLRESLDESDGMLFIFDDEEIRNFWMKNTLIPLDMIFISKNLDIVDIKYAVPCENDPCISYVSIEPAKYALEVNGNFTMKNDISIGDRISIN